MSVTNEVPKRALFKASEVCAIAGVQPYVLRSWEAEFPSLGTSKSASGPRVYRRADVERVLEIKQLLFGEGLTLGAVRRRLEADVMPEPEGSDVALQDLLGQDARERIADVKSGLREILALLGGNGAECQPLFDVAPARAGAEATRPKVSRPARKPREARAPSSSKGKRTGT
jgi:DNA-binding transcriptional MerR regulator